MGRCKTDRSSSLLVTLLVLGAVAVMAVVAR
jgi:hypothetical protein